MLVCLNLCYDLFILADSDADSYSDSDCKPNGYIVLDRTFHTAQSQIEIQSKLSTIGMGPESGLESESASVNVSVNVPGLQQRKRSQ